jgi:hypothetical protein
VVGHAERAVGLAVDHRAGAAQCRHRFGVLLRTVLRQRRNAAGRGHAGDLEAVLDRHRQTGQWRERCTAGATRVDVARRAHRSVGVGGDYCVDVLVERITAPDVVLEQLHRADTACRELGQCFNSGPLVWRAGVRGHGSDVMSAV